MNLYMSRNEYYQWIYIWIIMWNIEIMIDYSNIHKSVRLQLGSIWWIVNSENRYPSMIIIMFDTMIIVGVT